MKYSLSFFDDNMLSVSSNLVSDFNLLLNIDTKSGKFIYNSTLNNFTFLKNNLNKLFSNVRFLHVSLLNINRFILNFQTGFYVELILVGLGFKVIRSRKLHRLYFELHYSHNIVYNIPSDILVKCGKKKLIVFGLNKQRVLDVSQEIKNLRLPNIYKGKGIRFFNEVVKLKPGKQRS